MKKIIAGILTLLLSFAVSAQEGPRTYWTLGGSLMTYEVGSVSLEPINVFGRLGYDFNENIGIGFEGSFSMLEDDFLGLDWSITTTFIYLKASMPVGDDAKIYAMIGPSNVELSASSGGASGSADDSDTGIGFGFETGSYTVDYINYYDKNGETFSAINLGFVNYF